MKTLGIIALAVASLGLVLFAAIVVPADRRGEAACMQAMFDAAPRPTPHLDSASNNITQELEALHANTPAPPTAATEACDEHRRQRTPELALCALLLGMLFAGMVMYKRGQRNAAA